MDFPPAIVHEIVIDHQAAASKHLAEMSPQDLDKDWKLNDLFGLRPIRCGTETAITTSTATLTVRRIQLPALLLRWSST